MAIIYSYPKIEEISGNDLLLISDDSKANRTYSASVTQLSDYVIDEAFNGTENYIPVFNSVNSLVNSVLSQESGDNPTWIKTDTFIKLGVGTLNNPEAQLHVRKSGGGEAIRVENGNVGFYNGSTKHSYIGKETNTNPSLVLESIGANNKIVFKTGGTERIRITGSGKVGINTSAVGDGQRLKVAGTERNVVVTEAGSLGVGLDVPQHPIHCSGTIKSDGRIVAEKFLVDGLNPAPNTPTSPGVAGEVRFTSDYIYVCVSTNTWKRAAISTWT